MRNTIFVITSLAMFLASGEPPSISGTFSLSRLGESEWRAEYCFDEPVEALRLDRPFDGLRDSWAPVEEAFVLAIEAGTAEIRRVDGASFECTAFTLPTYTIRPEANYYAFSPFSDGGISVYTGYLIGPVLVDGEWIEPNLVADFRGRNGERIVTREAHRLVHQFVYFGTQEVLETGGLVAVIDPAMPPVARENILETIPAVNELLDERFDFRPSSPYMVFMATEMDAFDGYSIKGGTQRNQILFTIKGRGVPEMMEENPTHFSRTTAHEVIHLWQNEHWFEMLGVDRPWVHEGSADAIAFEVMRTTGIWDEAHYEEVWNDTESQCSTFLEKTSIHEAPENEVFDVAYACGALVNRIAGEAIRPDDPGEGILTLWRAIADQPEEDRKMPSEELFLRTLELLGLPEAGIDSLRGFLSEPAEDPAGAITKVRTALMRKE